MRHEPILLALLIFIPGLAAGATVSPSFPSGTVYFDFNKPNSSVDTFAKVETLILTNAGNLSVTFTDLNVTITGIDGVTVAPALTSKAVGGSTPEKVNLTFTADSSMSEGEYVGSLKVSGVNVDTRSLAITVEINHPLATINATWNPTGLGNVKAGSNFSYTLTVSEVMGYQPAKSVNVSIFEFGPVENLVYSGILGDFGPLASKDIKVTFEVPDRGVDPGTYSITPRITSASVVKANSKELNYTVPSPTMEVNPIAIDFGKITFETGKDRSTVSLNISETGGYTPIEGITVTLSSGDENWISYSDIDYVPAGGSKSFDFGIFLPGDASLGVKNWDFELDTSHAGSKAVDASVIVTFPGTEEAIANLENTSRVTGTETEDNLIKDTISLLENSKDKTQLRKIAMVMSVYSGVRTFLSNIGIAVGSGENLVDAGDAIIRAKAALNKMEIGDNNIDDAELKIHSSKAVAYAKDMWESQTSSVLLSLEENAESEKDSNYKLTAVYYNRISEIYSILGEPENAEKYSEKEKEIEELYHETLLEASALTVDADNKLEAAREKTFSPGENTYIVLNPFSYDFVSGSYESAILNYESAGLLYKKAGEESDANHLDDELAEITRQKNNIFRAFIVYGSLLGLVFLWFVGRAIWGLQQYTKDEMDSYWGDVVKGEEARGK
jgi:hypothetical protein